MSISDDDRTSPRTNTLVDQTKPFDDTDQAQPRVTQLSDTTGLVRPSGFRELLPGTVVNEIYEIDARLGSGAMGEVYAARHVKLGKRVAIKVIGKRLSEDDAAIERFANEARTLAQIQHPAIVTVDHIGELPDGRAYFVMELLRGESLFDRLARGRLPLAEALRIFEQMTRGLEAAHAEGIIHRDLKPENTFLIQLQGEAASIKLLDFGLAKLAASDRDQRAERTQSGVAIGTPMYMSPEQMRGHDVDQRTDIYALGCVAYELFLGTLPFSNAHSVPELYAAHLHQAPPMPRSLWPEIPPQLDLVLFAMLAKDPKHRPTLEQVRQVIADVRLGTPAQRASTEFVRQPEPKRGSGWIIPTIAIASIVLGIAIGMTAMGKKHVEHIQHAPEQVRVEPETPAVTTNVPPSPPPPPIVQTVTPVAPTKVTKPKHVHTALPADAGIDAHIDTAPKP